MRPGLQALLPKVANIARNPTRQTQPTGQLFSPSTHCEVCTTPTDGWQLCLRCRDHRERFGADSLADLVVPLSYAVKGHSTLAQYYFDLHNYKATPVVKPARNRLLIMMLAFKDLHLACLERAVGPVDVVTSVPSGRGRPGPHPLEVFYIVLLLPFVDAVHVGASRAGRAADADPDAVVFRDRLKGHVLIIEDAWVKGNNAQSLAVAAKRAGAERVSIVALGRVLDMAWGPSAQFVDRNLVDARWSPLVCPVTGSSC